ncbi:hypothetical protein L7F22_040415 [Adiantum nelumboides]|nr:hypothetical protein [Adiantum nelumboides]
MRMPNVIARHDDVDGGDSSGSKHRLDEDLGIPSVRTPANRLFINGKKSEFFMKEIKYLGHIISKEGIRMDPEKLRVIEEWPEPCNVHELRSFLGMCSYYRRFIRDFSRIAGPLHDLTKKKVKYVWTPKENTAFMQLKAKLMTQPLLVLPDLKKPFEVHCDACGDSIGAVLSQEGHPIAYESRRLNSQERVLGVYEKELISVIHALQSWKHYLLGTAFVIYTDHQSIRYFMTQTKLSEKQMRWANFLSQFHFHIAHVAGKKNQVVDALSRRPRANAVSIAYNHDLTCMIAKYAEDSDYQGIMQGLTQGQVIEPYSLNEGFLLYENRLCVTKDMREKVMSESHEPPYAGHRGIQPTTKAIELYFYWPHMRQDIEDYVSKCIVCQKVKYERGKSLGLLQPLPIPDVPWQSISMDFVFGLPRSIQGNNGIWTIVDRFSKQAHFLPIKKTIKAKNMATMFISQIFKYHGMPSSIVSDRDPRMTSLFWQGLFENLGTKLNFSSAYHPQTDGQSEIANSIVLDLLKSYVEEVAQSNQWEKYLPLVERTAELCWLSWASSKRAALCVQFCRAPGLATLQAIPASGKVFHATLSLIAWFLSIFPSSTASSCSPASLPADLGSLTHLQHLSLPYLNLSGPFPFSLAANWPQLRSLNLSHNTLSGSLPASLCARLPYLSLLDLHSNQLSGSIPPDIGLCHSLVSLWLQNNNLSGSVPPAIGQLSNLEFLHAGGNTHLGGSIPSELGNCSSLIEFGLTETSISGSIPPSLGRLSKLKAFVIQSANLSGNIPPELGNCSSLEHIDVDDNKLVGPIPTELSKLKILKWFNLWGNGLSGAIPSELGMLESLEMMELSENQLGGTIPASLGRLSKLHTLHLSMNNLYGEIPAELGNCSSMIDLQLDRNMLTKGIPAEIGKLSKFQGLYLWNNSLEGEIPATLANCKELAVIDLSWNLLRGSLNSDVFSLPSLKHIIAVRNNFSGEVPSSIAKCKQLIRLRLDMNRLTGFIPREIGELGNLTVFDISRNQILGGIPDTISNCRALQRFDAHENFLQGPVPAELGSLSDLVYLDLSYNHLEGPLPETLGRLHNLNILIVSANRLSGTIPADWSNCQKLTYVDLSSNSLSGSIPSSLGQITGLDQMLNVSCNSLSGTIPDSFAQLMSLAALDVSQNSFSGYLDVFGKMGSLISLNISDNLFCGNFPNSTFFKSLPERNYASCFAAANGCSKKGGIVRNKAIFLLLFGPMGLIFVGSCILLYSICKKSSGLTTKREFELWAPWLLTPFQKLHFTMQDIIDSKSDTNIIGKGSSGGYTKQ